VIFSKNPKYMTPMELKNDDDRTVLVFQSFRWFPVLGLNFSFLISNLIFFLLTLFSYIPTFLLSYFLDSYLFLQNYFI